jgi:hypothetical protein
MKTRQLIIAVALPAVALAAGVLAAVPAHQHGQGPSYGQQADGGPLLQQPAFEHRSGSRGDRASSHRSKHALKNAANRGIALTTFANVDYASNGGYGTYDPAALHDSWVQSVVINLDWANVETSPGVFNWAPLDNTATAWADAGKHVVLVVRAADEGGGGCDGKGAGQFLPLWEITALHNAMGRIGTFCDKVEHSLVPDWFSGTFQSDFQGFVRALGAHVSGQPYLSSISYVRIGVGLAGEGFFLFPQPGYAADKAWMVTNWHYTPQAWENFQETMMGAYRAAFPASVQLIYAISQQDNLPDGDPVDLAVAEWAANLGDVGIGEECLGPNGPHYGIADYADFGIIDSWLRANHPNAYIQFQTCGQTTSASEEQGIIQAAEDEGAKSIEWYENTIVSPPSESEMTAYETWATSTFKA